MDFDHVKHLSSQDVQVKFTTMKDLGYGEDKCVSPVAITQPFPLFSDDAIDKMRSEIFQVRDSHPEHVFVSNIADCQLRGYAKRHAPFTYQAWNHPRTLAILSRLAGVELVPWGDYEIAHINFSTDSHDDKGAIVDWHTDSYPFVCVLMLSDSANMNGGETALLKADGGVKRVGCPAKGWAIVLQGHCIAHRAVRALGGAERITSVTSFRPKSPFIRDDTKLNTVRPISDLSELYFQYTEYKIEGILVRFRSVLERFRSSHESGEKTSIMDLKAFLGAEMSLLAHMDEQIIAYENVIPGCIPKAALPPTPCYSD